MALVVGWMEENRCTSWYLWDYWESLKGALQGINFTIMNVFREGNQVVDFLAQERESGMTHRYLDRDIVPRLLCSIIRNGQAWLSQLAILVYLVSFCCFL